MKKKGIRLWSFLYVVIVVGLLATCGWAKDWHELSSLSEVDLTKKISELQARLKENPNDYDVLKGLGIAFHTKARKEEASIPNAVEFLTKAYEMNKEDTETMCYLGSATTMMAKTTWNPMDKMRYVNDGTALMDKAVRKDPNNISVRMTRANNSKSLPSYLNRGNVAVEDFEYLAGLIEKDPKRLANIRKEVYSNLSELYQKNGNREKAERYKKMAEAI